MSLEVGCLSFRQPYAGLVLNGLKSIETRWRPLLAETKSCTLAIHIAQKDWEGDDWRNILTENFAMKQSEVEELLESGERFGRGVVAGLVDVGETWFCSEDIPPEQMRELEKAACLTGLAQKYLTRLSNPRWLSEPLYSRGQKDMWMTAWMRGVIQSMSSLELSSSGVSGTGNLVKHNKLCIGNIRLINGTTHKPTRSITPNPNAP